MQFQGLFVSNGEYVYTVVLSLLGTVHEVVRAARVFYEGMLKGKRLEMRGVSDALGAGLAVAAVGAAAGSAAEGWLPRVLAVACLAWSVAKGRSKGGPELRWLILYSSLLLAVSRVFEVESILQTMLNNVCIFVREVGGESTGRRVALLGLAAVMVWLGSGAWDWALWTLCAI